jgi:hypothetical protein
MAARRHRRKLRVLHGVTLPGLDRGGAVVDVSDGALDHGPARSTRARLHTGSPSCEGCQGQRGLGGGLLCRLTAVLELGGGVCSFFRDDLFPERVADDRAASSSSRVRSVPMRSWSAGSQSRESGREGGRTWFSWVVHAASGSTDQGCFLRRIFSSPRTPQARPGP